MCHFRCNGVLITVTLPQILPLKHAGITECVHAKLSDLDLDLDLLSVEANPEPSTPLILTTPDAVPINCFPFLQVHQKVLCTLV